MNGARNTLTVSRRLLAEYARRIHRESLVLNFEGNVSIRLQRDKCIAITPSQQPKSQLTEDQILLTDCSGKLIQGAGRPSTEIKMHLSIYKARKDINAIIHTHSSYASALAASRKQLPVFLDEQLHFLRGAVLCARYAPAGSEELAKSAVKGLGDRMAVLLANHGVLSCGSNLEEAFRNALLVERSAQVYLLSKLVGGSVKLPRGDVHSG